MVGVIILSIYILGVVIRALVFPKLFPYEEGEWEILCGEAMPIDEEEHKMNLAAMCIIWPLILAMVIVVVLPVKCVEYLSRMI